MSTPFFHFFHEKKCLHSSLDTFFCTFFDFSGVPGDPRETHGKPGNRGFRACFGGPAVFSPVRLSTGGKPTAL